MEPEVVKRIGELIAKGNALLSRRGHSGSYPNHWVPEQLLVEAQAWTSSVANIVRLLGPSGSFFVEELDRLVTHDQMKTGAPWGVLQKLHGLLTSLNEEVGRGLVQKLEYVVIATTFDDFLDHAEAFHKANKPREAGVLAAVVLEDTIKKIAAKNSVSSSGKSLEQLVDDLAKANVFTPVKAKRVKAYAGVRNPALHAEWDQFDIRDAGELIAGTRELIEHFL